MSLTASLTHKMAKHTPFKMSNEVKLAKTLLVCRPMIILRFGWEYAGRDVKIFRLYI